MFLPEKPVYKDELLIRYLVGSLPEDETERLDELSITDDEFACRLRDVENDLVDAYSRGELSGETLERFESFYFSSARGRRKVQFAQTLLAEGHPVSIPPPTPSPLFVIPRLSFKWALVGVTGLLVLAGAYLWYENRQLGNQLAQA